ncbi:MAG: hypothetical protein JWQ40_5039 [Segetibacter sp.]|nr:hypothetical protein [Segetibacter sp.]
MAGSNKMFTYSISLRFIQMQLCYVLKIILFIFLLGSCKKNVADVDIQKKLATLTLKELDTCKLPRTSISSYDKATNYAISLAKDSNADKQIRGQVLLSIIGDHLKNEMQAGELDYGDDDVKSLITKFEQQDFLIGQHKISNFLKLANYTCEGRYMYIWDRFKGSWYFLPVLVFLIIFITLSIINLIINIRWKYRRICNVFFVIFLCFALIAALLFKKTCGKYVTSDSFYGINM